jgi:hypothetical protein
MDELHFNLEIDEEGNYCVCAEVPDGALITDAPDLDSLLKMIQAVVALYAEEQGIAEPSFSIHFPAPIAA